jgi:hypothetical protein
MRVRGGGGSRHVGGGATSRHRGGGGAATHISTESSELEEGRGVVRRRRLELPTSCIREGGGAVRWLELPTSWPRGGGAMRLEREANLP